MERICKEKMCSGCMACADACPKSAIEVEPGADCYRPIINQAKCIDCGKCVSVCQQLNPSAANEPIAWYQGWDANADSRSTSSSGGLASAIARGFISHGGLVCACEFVNGSFVFGIADSVEDISRFKGSKYVKSNPSGTYEKVRALLKEGRKVLFVGLPCQVSAMKKSISPSLAKGLYTVDLICHGTPSPQILSAYLHERGIEVSELDSIAFRTKGSFQLKENDCFIDTPGVVDSYSMAFLAGLDYTENCYSCSYASTRRVADISLGDSWGTELVDEAAEGISLVLCQSEKGQELLEWAGASLRDVDVDVAIQNNGQLRAPSRKPASRDTFLLLFDEGIPLSSIVRRCLPKAYYRQCLKRILLKTGLLKRGGVGYGICVTHKAEVERQS